MKNLIIILIFFKSIFCFGQQDTVYYYQALKAEHESDYYKAIQLYTKAIEYSNPNSGELCVSYIYRGFSKFNINDNYGAIDDLRKGISTEVKTSKVFWIIQKEEMINTINKFAYNVLGYCYIKINNTDSACTCFSKAFKLGDIEANELIKKYCNNSDNSSIDYFKEKANEALENENYNDALKYIDKVIELDKNDDKAYAFKGIVLSKMDNDMEAITELSKSITINPKNYISLTLRGLSYFALQLNEMAIKDFSSAIALNPTESDIYYFRGLVKENIKLFESAIADYNTTIFLNPKRFDAYYRKGLAQINVDVNNACESFIKAYELGCANAYEYVKVCNNKNVTPIYNYEETPCIRIGAICLDGWQSNSTGKGACSHHGGVYKWLCK